MKSLKDYLQEKQLTTTERHKKAITAKRNKNILALKRNLAKRSKATNTLKQDRAQRNTIRSVEKKMAGGKAKSSINYAQRGNIEKRALAQKIQNKISQNNQWRKQLTVHT